MLSAFIEARHGAEFYALDDDADEPQERHPGTATAAARTTAATSGPTEGKVIRRRRRADKA